ncbi:helix-turn-helix domain-containing protein [Legionella londiniensis]|uniref:Putative transcriptional regulator n=1 Tax=Legionella londiniensis TaxID=45068 RepID=A0A0W0VHV0_9GAMM|nr:helix-turn-helix transcriptional regulator [Legionella londiniensis]KTD19694.1 putative transcriptional regulator [Legionella londiniensis]STX92396.1 putative transcriptional regulator [Legionella londiniensis]
MEKVDLTKQFAYRLRDTLIAAGYNSQRSTSGVNIHKLAEITGYSPQICRKYLRGQAIPEPGKLVEIAEKLHVSPGWLLFGDSHSDRFGSEDEITIKKSLLHYIFTQAKTLYNAAASDSDVSDFLLDLANDVSQINANEEQSKKIIDLALSSIRHFGHSQGSS